MGRSAEEQDDFNLNDDGEDDDDIDRGDDVDTGTDADDDLDPDELAALADDRSRSVPHARFNEVNEQLKEEKRAREAVEQRLAALEGRVPAKEPEPKAPAFDFDAKEDAYVEALMEGDSAKAREIRKEIRAAERAEIEAEVEARTSNKIGQQESTRLFMDEAERVIEKYPFLADGKGQSAEAVAEVKEWRDFYIAKGDPAHTALRKAAAKVGPMYAEEDDDGDDDDGKPAKKLSLVEMRKQKQAQDRIRNAKASGQQPPAVKGGMGERGRNRTLSVADLTDEEFDKLTPAEKKELRGDSV